MQKDLIECFSILESLPDQALAEAHESLVQIAEFYRDRGDIAISNAAASLVKGILSKSEIRPPIIFE